MATESPDERAERALNYLLDPTTPAYSDAFEIYVAELREAVHLLRTDDSRKPSQQSLALIAQHVSETGQQIARFYRPLDTASLVLRELQKAEDVAADDAQSYIGAQIRLLKQLLQTYLPRAEEE